MNCPQSGLERVLGNQKIPDRRRGLTRKTLAIVCAAWVVVMLLPLLAISFYAHPVHDDFPHTLDAVEAWAKTGDLMAVLDAAWARMTYMYETWQGTFAAMLLSAFQPMVFSPRLFFLTPVFMILTLSLAAAYFCKALVMGALRAGKCETIIVYAAFMTFLLQFLPSAREVLYWQSGVPYTLSLVCLLLMLGLMMKLHNPQHIALRVWRCLALFVSAIMLGGCPYPLALSGVVGMGLVTAWCFLRRSPARFASLFGLVGVTAALIIVVAAPGNGVRQAAVGWQMSPVAAVIQSVSECLQMTGEWFSPQLAALALLLLPVLWQPLKESGVRFQQPLWGSVFSFGVLAAAFVPPIYATGVEGYLVERVLSSLYMLYALLVLINVVYWIGWLAQTCSSQTKAIEFTGRMPLWRAALCVGLLIWGLFSAAIMVTPTIASSRSLLTGEAARYHAEMSRREVALASAASQEEAVSCIQALSAEPAMLPRDMLPYQKETALPKMMHRYYRIQELCAQYGPGQIPPNEWEALELWTTE